MSDITIQPLIVTQILWPVNYLRVNYLIHVQRSGLNWSWPVVTKSWPVMTKLARRSSKPELNLPRNELRSVWGLTLYYRLNGRIMRVNMTGWMLILVMNYIIYLHLTLRLPQNSERVWGLNLYSHWNGHTSWVIISGWMVILDALRNLLYI